MPYFYGFDSLYLILVLPAILITLVAQIRVKSTFSKYSKYNAPLNGAAAAERVLRANGVTGVRIERVSGNLTDHYDPKANVIRLSEAVYDTYSIAAVGVACHEAGHAVQYAKDYSPVRFRMAIIPVCNIGSRLAFPLILIGLFLNAASALSSFFITLGILFFCLAVLFQVVTLPVEFDASRRAIATIRSDHILPEENQIRGAKSVLTAAAMTYVAALLVSLMQLIRLIAIANRRR